MGVPSDYLQLAFKCAASTCAVFARYEIRCERGQTLSEVRQYDAVVIGAGQAGGPLSTALARSGLKTAIIEQEHVGGTCINEGCTPTKTMVASGRVAYLARRAADYGVHTGAVSVDMLKVRQRKRDIVESFRSNSERRITETPGVDLLMGTASFTGPYSLEVRLKDETVLQINSRLIFINTGARPAMPPVDGLNTVPTLNSTTIMELDVVPEHLLVLGGGYVALEFGQMFRRFGSNVTIVQRSGQLLGREDTDIAEAVAQILHEDGIEVLLNTKTLRAEAGDNSTIRLTVRTPEG
ncbi:MAG: mercuric reductase, partial [Chloroflexi bacterium]|nr:mercuric reductase [Chloroflexota bacterium]